jgi:hypothetical protein
VPAESLERPAGSVAPGVLCRASGTRQICLSAVLGFVADRVRVAATASRLLSLARSVQTRRFPLQIGTTEFTNPTGVSQTSRATTSARLSEARWAQVCELMVKRSPWPRS